MSSACRSASASPSSSPSCARGRCGGRSPSRSSCSPAFRRSSTASGACSCSRRSCRRTVQPFLIRPVPRRAGAQQPVCRPALRHRPVDLGADPGDHGPALHHLDHPRRLRNGAGGAQGIGLRHRLHHLGSDPPGRDSLYPRRHHGRRDAGARPRAGRDDGRDLRHRQRPPHQPLAVLRRARRSRPPSPTNSPRPTASSTPRRWWRSGSSCSSSPSSSSLSPAIC